MHHQPDWPTYLNAFANLAIVGGYILIPFTVLRHIPLTPFVRTAGMIFFMTCAATHAAMAFGAEHHWLLYANHILQAGAVWFFVTGFARLVGAANRRRARRGGEPDKAHQ